MARIAGVDLPRNKRVEIGLTYIFGIGHSSSKKYYMKQRLIPILERISYRRRKFSSSEILLKKNILLKGN